MSFYNDASLVVIPSGYKTSKVYAEKPTDGSGDLAFTRTGDTATRVNSAGIIEKVRTNLVLQSETFDNASWTKSLDGQVTITANAAVAPNGTTTADKIIPSAIAGFHCVQQQVTLSAGEASISVYAKAAENSFLQFFDALTTDYVNFNLTTGVVGSSGDYVGSIENAGSGWYRCKATKVVPSGTFSARIGVVTSATAARGESFTGNGTNGLLIWGAQLEYGVATDYIATTSAAVSVGPVANVPRLDYLNSSCPRLLLEPQRTNLVQFSESFDNAYWSKGGLNVSANNTTSPDGYINADKITENTTSLTTHYLNRGITLTAASHTLSVFAKAAERKWIFLIATTSMDNGAFFDLENGAVGNVSAGYSAKIENYENGWYKCSLTFTGTAATWYMNYLIATANNTYNYSGTIGSGIFVWGAQLEAGAYATSYIPTLAASATRGADACSKTGISSLIGQTEGTFYHQFSVPVDEAVTRSVVLSNGTTANRVALSVFANALFARVDVGGVNQVNSSATIVPTATNKIAFRYKANDFAAYVNGVKVITDTSGSTFTAGTLNQIAFVQPDSTSPFNGRSNQVLLFTTALTDAELATLTTL